MSDQRESNLCHIAEVKVAKISLLNKELSYDINKLVIVINLMTI